MEQYPIQLWEVHAGAVKVIPQDLQNLTPPF
jgi:hypothetical protein